MMQKKFLVAVFFVLSTCLSTIPAVPSSAYEEMEHGREAEVADLGIEVIDGLVSMDVKNADIHRVLQELARKAKLELDISDGVDGKVTISAKARPLEDILKRLCENRAIVYQYIPEKKTFRIISVGAYSKGKSKRSKARVKGKSSVNDNMQAEESPHPSKEFEPLQQERVHDSRGRLLYKPGELLIKFKKGATAKQISDLHKSLGSTVLRRISRIRLQRVQLRKGLSERDAIEAYMASGIVEMAERHALRYADAIPDDEYFGDQWGLAKIHAPEAWNITTGGSGIIIAVVDTGVDYLHPDLKNNIWVNTDEVAGDGADNDGNGFIDDLYGWDFADNDSEPMDIDMDGHGTHVAGIIAAEGNNAVGITGVCWNAKIMVLKVQSDASNAIDDFDIIRAMYYAMDKGARIVNCSFGGGSYEDSEYEAISQLREAGIIAVCAAGNNGTDNDYAPEYPASYELDNIIAVAASDQSDNLADFSNYGAKSVDVMAPGVGIKSTVPASSNFSFGNMSGTSMAAPHVAGIAGLILSKNPTLDYSAVKSAILDTVDKISDVSGRMVSGGRVNALNALCSLNTFPGDLSFNGMVGLEDAIIAIQIISGLHPTICPVCIAAQIDINGDSRIGLEDAIYIMQKISGIR